jgi:two-component system response regulator YesN
LNKGGGSILYKVVVIDDEPKVRRGLSRLIPELDPEWYVVGQAQNGLEGLQIVKDERPDLVITDIRMPKLNGLDLLNDLRNYPGYVVILSGYGYFEYAQTAIRFGALDYLLKPMKPEQILNILTQVKKLKQKESLTKHNLEEKNDHTLVWKEWLLDPIGMKQPPELLDKLVHLDGRSYQMILIEIDSLDELITEDQWGDRQLVLFAVRNIVSDIIEIDRQTSCMFMLQHGGQLLYLAAGCKDVKDLCFEMIKSVHKWLKISVSIGISKEHQNLPDIPLALQQANEAIKNKWIYGLGSVSDFADFQIEDVLSSGYPIHLEESLIIAMRSCNKEEAIQNLKQFIEQITNSRITFRLFHRFYLQLSAAVVRVLYEYKIYDVVMKESPQLFDLIEKKTSVDNLYEGMKQIISVAIEAVEWTKSQKNQRTIDRSLEYIHNRYMNDISLDNVAEAAQMSSGYFSTLFKQEKGITFIEYLTRLRVDKAKSLMADDQLRLYEISEMVGYQDVKYFSRVFKRMLGITPAEYRVFFFRKEQN